MVGSSDGELMAWPHEEQKRLSSATSTEQAGHAMRGAGMRVEGQKKAVFRLLEWKHARRAFFCAAEGRN